MKSKIVILFFAIILLACSPNPSFTSTIVPTSKPSLTPTNTPLPLPTNTPTLVPSPTQIGGGSGTLIFEYYKAAYEKDFPNLKGEINIFTSDIDGDNLMPITDGLDDFNRIVNISPDGKVVLVASRPTFLGKSTLYLINLDSTNSEPIKLVSELDGTAIFLENSRIVYAGKGSQGYGFYTINIDGTDEKKIGVPAEESPWIISTDGTYIFWYAWTKENFYFDENNWARGTFRTLWRMNIDGSEQSKLESNGYPLILKDQDIALSPDGTHIAWIPRSWELHNECPDGGANVWASWVRDGVYTQNATNKQNVFYGKTVDISYAEDLVRRCFLIYVASLSDIANPIKIPLLPPFNPATDDFMYHNDYSLIWSPDGSKILAFDNGGSSNYADGLAIFANYYPVAIYEIDPNNAKPKLELLKNFSTGVEKTVETQMDFSPDGRLLLVTNYDPHTNFYSAEVNILNLDTMNFIGDFSQNLIQDAQEKRVGEIFWIP